MCKLNVVLLQYFIRIDEYFRPQRLSRARPEVPLRQDSMATAAPRHWQPGTFFLFVNKNSMLSAFHQISYVTVDSIIFFFQITAHSMPFYIAWQSGKQLITIKFVYDEKYNYLYVYLCKVVYLQIQILWYINVVSSESSSNIRVNPYRLNLVLTPLLLTWINFNSSINK